jgi:hypothetical protein
MKSRQTFFLTIMALCFPLIALAQSEPACDECDARRTLCSNPCWYCTVPSPDNNYCAESNVVHTTCGQYTACIPDDCQTNYQEVSREVRGTYGDHMDMYTPYGWVSYCEHHVVEWVTSYDSNQCSTGGEWAWTDYFCDDTVHGSKFDMGYGADCCDGRDQWGQSDSTFNCDHHHYC